MKDAQNPWTIGVSHLKPVPGPGAVPVHLSPLTADLHGELRGQARMRGCPHRGCRAVEERCCCCLVGGPGLGRQLLGLGPLRGDACSAWGKMQLSLPPSPVPLLLSFTFFSLFPVCFSQLLPWGPSLGEGGGRLPLQGSRDRAAASAEWRGVAVEWAHLSSEAKPAFLVCSGYGLWGTAVSGEV